MQSIPKTKETNQLFKDGKTVITECHSGELPTITEIPEMSIHEIRQLLVGLDVIATKPRKATQNMLMVELLS